MNQSYTRVNAPYAMHKVFEVQLYKNNACTLLLRILCILNSDWLQHARSIRGVYELPMTVFHKLCVLWIYVENLDR